MLKPTVIAIPLFAILIAIEAYFVIRGDRERFDKLDTWNNILIGFVSVAIGGVISLVTAGFYVWVYEFAPVTMPMETWWSWALLVVIDDLAYYWFHRFSHEMRFLWNFHVVHHSSEQYNLSVAVRQSWFGGAAHWIFYLPLAFIGFPFPAFVFVHGLNLIYQFWIHTKMIDRLGPLEWVFNTPSHHRVHHGVNEQYLDKNYGGIFIVWDRLFGTFEDELEEVRYGIVKPVDSYNALWINLHAWFEMADAMRGAHGIRNKLRCVFGSPNIDQIGEDRPVLNVNSPSTL